MGFGPWGFKSLRPHFPILFTAFRDARVGESPTGGVFLSHLRRRTKPLIALVALLTLALVFSACAYFKEGSLSLSQPGGIGPVRVHFTLCTEPEPECSPASETEEVQYLLGVAVPPGSTPPATVTAVPVGGGSPLTFTRNDEVATEIAAASANLKKLAEKEGEAEKAPPVWPPAGLQGVGYISNALLEQEGVQVEWNVDADFGLPVAADGSPYPGPFATGLSLGFREVSPTQSASRPVHCWRFEGEPQEGEAFCFGTAMEGQTGTADLRVAAPAPTSVFLGGKAAIAFPFNFAATASPSPTFALSATSTLPKAKLSLASPTLTPGTPDPNTHRAPTAEQEVSVTVPKNAKPGTYEVTITATAPQGGTTSQTTKLKVTKPKLKLGGVKLNKATGTATLSVKVPGAGTLTVAGKGIVKAKKKAKKAKRLMITIKVRGATKAELDQLGRVKVRAKLTFKPTSGIAAKKTKSITLKQH